MGSTGAADGNGSLYFAYGSNLSSSQMRDRCPSSTPVGLARLCGWTWLINKRGYANIVNVTDSPHSSAERPVLPPFNPLPLLPLSTTQKDASQDSDEGGVYGVLYRLHPNDEKMLDAYEGVPYAYERVFLDAVIVPPPGAKDQKQTETTLNVLVYIDKKNIHPGQPRAEYVYRMNRGIDEATSEWGLPQAYVDTVMRPFIPAKK
ncbi:hypothetical protein F4818DRAFT_214208 [Hypoxylon cercidicola]|nr:hypothetical protein F4818DRAFT_214208 [Hypoxylon cercidicola]